ncbi:hypothetical protein SY89_00468 [Halolamina pelagica]|uniref:Uncharacterized protein n=1 Tax=Halolamina pelagica TaxID=699431 RepID=A0A0P7G8X6_9EURY|nr:hypothetical protein [Halolamina pelagica]KPN29751.1 hypothetical protein SY89_00468 [Halolamina pelagica]
MASATPRGAVASGNSHPRTPDYGTTIDIPVDELVSDDLREAEDGLEDDDEQDRAYDNEQRLFGAKWLHFVREQLADAPNRFSHDWDGWLYGLLEEE